MPDIKAIRLTPEDRSLLTVLTRELGVSNVSDLMRMGLRTLARTHGISIPEPHDHDLPNLLELQPDTMIANKRRFRNR